MTTVARNLGVRPVQPADAAAIRTLLTKSLGSGPTGSRTPEFFDWKHRANPFGASAGLVAEVDDRIVAVRLFLRWHLEANGHPVRALRAVDTATDPEYRGLGLFRRLTLELLRDLDAAGEVDLVFNTPNRSSRPGYLKMGWREVGTLPVRLSPIRAGRLLRGLRGAARSTASARHTAPGSMLPNAPKGQCPFPAAADVLSERATEVEELLLRGQRPSGLHTPRTLGYLAWRFGQAPGLDYRCITLDSPQGLRGLAIGRMRRRGQVDEFTVSDVMVEPEDRRGARRLLWMARGCGADCATVHTTPGSAVDSAAASGGFLTVPRVGVGLVANARRTLPVNPMLMGSWQLSLGDLEVF